MAACLKASLSPPSSQEEMYEDLVEDGKLRLLGVIILTDLTVIPRDVRELVLIDCSGLASFVGLPEGLQTLIIWKCPGLTSLFGLPEGLQSLTISRCDRLTALPLLPNLQALSLDRPLAVCGQPVQTLEAYQAVCRSHMSRKSAYA